MESRTMIWLNMFRAGIDTNTENRFADIRQREKDEMNWDNSMKHIHCIWNQWEMATLPGIFYGKSLAENTGL